MPYTIHKSDFTLIYNGQNYTIPADQADIENAITQTKVFNKARTGRGVKQITGGENADRITFSTTYMNKDLASALINTIYNGNEDCTVLISSKTDPEKTIELSYAVLESPTLQTSVDDTAGMRYSFSFAGALTRQMYHSED